MAQWEEKLGAILNDPQAMSQIAALAQSLEGGGAAPAAGAAAAGAAGAEPGIDAKVMEAGMRALSAWQGPDDSRTALLQALRPFLKEERRGKLDKAVRITKLSKVVRAALDTFQGGEGDV